MKVKYFVSETNTLLVFNFAKEYDEAKVLEDMDGFYHEWQDPDDAGVDGEMLDEIETSTPESWIVDHMYDLGDYDIEDVDEIEVDDKMGKIIALLEGNISELKGYTEDDERDDLETHDCVVAIETYQLVLDAIKDMY